MLVVKNLPANAADVRNEGSIPRLERSPRGGHGNPLKYSCLENPMDRGVRWSSAHRVTEESDTTEATQNAGTPMIHGQLNLLEVESMHSEKPWTQRNSGYASLATSYDQNFAIVEGQHFNPHCHV